MLALFSIVQTVYDQKSSFVAEGRRATWSLDLNSTTVTIFAHLTAKGVLFCQKGGHTALAIGLQWRPYLRLKVVSKTIVRAQEKGWT